jgi:dimethylhistidine N-methyltransferase
MTLSYLPAHAPDSADAPSSERRPLQSIFARDVTRGLSAYPKRLASKYLYDDEGSRLFGQIRMLDEYYPTRTELGIFERSGAEMAQVIGPKARIVELGAGDDVKIRALLTHLEAPASYVPIDISRDTLLDGANRIARDFPSLEVAPLHADYTATIHLPAPGVEVGRTVAFFPGSTIGNFEPSEARHFLRRIRAMVGPGGSLLLGTDLKKDPRLLHAAYNDGKGVTAAFNLNLLARINRELGAAIPLDAFRHHAYYDAVESRIVMTLVAARELTVSLANHVLHFDEGEAIVTEYSYKFSVQDVARLAKATGFELEASWTDPETLFAVHSLRA